MRQFRIEYARAVSWTKRSRRAALVAVVLLLLGLGRLAAQEEAPADTLAVADTITDDRMRAEEILTQLHTNIDSLLVLESRVRGKSDEERGLIRVRAQRYAEDLDDLSVEFLELFSKLVADGAAVSSIRGSFVRFLENEMAIYERTLDWWVHEIEDLREARSNADPDRLSDIETGINFARGRIDRMLRGMARTLTRADSLGIETANEWAELDRVLKGRAETLVGRLQLAVAARDQSQTKIKDAERGGAPESEIAGERIRLQYEKRRVDGVARSLETTVEILSQRGYETAQYRQFIIKTTGQITVRVLDPKVLIGLVRDFFKSMWQWLKDNAPTVLVKCLIVLVFVVVFRLAFRVAWWLLRVVRLYRLTRLMADLVDRMINPFATIVGLFAGLWFLGVNPTTLLAGVGVAGVIIGFALQDSLANLAAGFFILATRPYDVDDVIVAGSMLGTVKAMGLANTTIVTFDNRRLLIPNRKIWGEVIENRSAESVRRVEITVRVGYGEDVDRIIGILHDLLEQEERVLKRPEPAIFVMELAESWMEIAVRPWVRNEDWWPLLTELPRLVRLRFAEEGIEIPYPRREISTREDHIGTRKSQDRNPGHHGS